MKIAAPGSASRNNFWDTGDVEDANKDVGGNAPVFPHASSAAAKPSMSVAMRSGRTPRAWRKRERDGDEVQHARGDGEGELASESVGALAKMARSRGRRGGVTALGLNFANL